MLYYLISTAALTALLFFPVSRLVWVLSVRRLERRTKRRLGEDERLGQRRRARFIAFFLVLVFSGLFNMQFSGLTGDG